jgi:hypothetical protein
MMQPENSEELLPCERNPNHRRKHENERDASDQRLFCPVGCGVGRKRGTNVIKSQVESQLGKYHLPHQARAGELCLVSGIIRLESRGKRWRTARERRRLV